MVFERPIYRVMGDRALLVELGDEISPRVNRRVRDLALRLERHPLEGILELIPGYRSLVVIYDPLRVALSALQASISVLQEEADSSLIPDPRTLRVPVVYGGEYGPDLEWVAQYHQITPEEVIRLHTETTYQVYMIGFTPGFPYMGELSDALATPRRQTPRTAVPKGSVGIGQKQTGIYPVQSPGGWQIIGRTPLKLFDALRWPPTPLEMGDLVKFFPIKEKELAHWES